MVNQDFGNYLIVVYWNSLCKDKRYLICDHKDYGTFYMFYYYIVTFLLLEIGPQIKMLNLSF